MVRLMEVGRIGRMSSIKYSDIQPGTISNSLYANISNGTLRLLKVILVLGPSEGFTLP